MITAQSPRGRAVRSATSNGEVGEAPASLGDHRGRQVEPGDVGAGHGEVGADLARSAADVGHRAAARQLGDPLEQPPVERLAVELVEELVGVRRRHLAVRRDDLRVSLGAGRERGRRLVVGVGWASGRSEPMDPARLLLTRLARQLLDQRLVPHRQHVQSGVSTWSSESKSCRRSDRERELAGRLRPAQQEQGDDGALGRRRARAPRRAPGGASGCERRGSGG